MCGIVGIWNFNSSKTTDSQLNVFTDSLAHRGPDQRGKFRDNDSNLCLGHRRLAILDLSKTGRQPMSYANGRYTIVHNGEVYNYLEIKAELEGLGHNFRGTSDTEVILAAYAQWGRQCLYRFNGMWAFAIWDKSEKTLFISRDRFGVKPLHYYYDSQKFAFASEAKSFLALDWFKPVFDRSAVARALNRIGELEVTEDCLWSGIKKLMGGHNLTLRPGAPPQITRWWSTLDNLVDAPERFDKQAEKFRELFFDACKIRMRSDVSVGAALSGGLDSSSIFCATSQINELSKETGATKKNITAFVASYEGTILDERKYAEEVLRFTGNSSVIKGMDIFEGIEHFKTILFDFEEIYDQFTSPWLIYQKMRKSGIVVSLEGHGGDELVAGYYHSPHLFVSLSTK